MRNLLTSRLLYCALRLVLGGVFIYAGIIKGSDPAAFAQSIDEYGLVTWRMAKIIANTLPALEILVGLGLVLDVRGALGMIVAQLLGFMGVLAYGIHLGLDVDCGCFGPSDSAVEHSGGLWPTLLRDALMFCACLIMYWQRRAGDYSPRPLTRPFTFKPKD